jgi:hypothetical protein
MSKGKHLFKKTDVKRGLRALEESGLNAYKIKINNDGQLEFEIAPPTAAPAETATADEWKVA